MTMEPEIVVMPDPADIVFDDRGTPILTYQRHAVHGEGWVLYFLEDDSDTAGVEDYFIPGRPEHINDALQAARRWLRLRESSCE